MKRKWAIWMVLMTLTLPISGAIRAQSDPKEDKKEAQVFRAKGNEPFWSLEISDKEITLKTMDSERPVVVAKPSPESGEGKTVYAVKNESVQLSATIEDKICSDNMTGMPHPKTVTVELNGKTLKGWGGEPIELLLGGEWRVTELNGKPLVPKSSVTIQFDNEGRVSGAASVNRYFGSFKLTGEGLSFPQPFGSSMMAGDDNLMAQESAFHQTMSAINYFKIESDGALFLGSPKEGSIKAYRAKVNPTKKADTGRELESVPWVIGESNPTTVTKAFRAKGNEPFWNLEICDTSITLNRMGETPLVFPKPEPKVEEKGIEIFTVKEDGVDLVVTIIDKISSDSMTGMPHPKTVVVEHKGAKLKGCGGDPVELLLGKEWIVEDLKGGAVVDGSSVSIQFKDGGWISGQASVNRYYAQYTLTGESLTISKVGTTRMAGDPALMKQESLFMRLLQDVQRFEIATDGALILHGATKGKITARRD